MTTKEIVIGRDYASVPGGRYERYGPFSGERFRDELLVPALREYERVVVYLDETKSLMSSFLEEAFGGLLRNSGFSLGELKQRFVVTATAPRYAIFLKMIEQDMEAAAAETAGTKPARVA